MRLYHWIGIAFLCAALLFCTSCVPTAEITHAPSLEPTPTLALKPTLAPAAWEADPGQFILDNLNAAFSDEMLYVRIFLNNGSGPASVAMLDSECGQEIRDLFSAYDWKVAQRPQDESIPFESFSVEFYDEDAPYHISFSTYSDVLYLLPFDDAMDTLYFSAVGAEKLCRDFTALCPNPVVQCSLVSCKAQKTCEDTARQFMENLFAVMMENGHIIDCRFSGLDIFDSSNRITFNVDFCIKAAHPELNLWTSEYSQYPVDEFGWTDTIKWKVYLTTNAENEVYRLDWID